MATKIQIRRDTAANWTSNDPVLSLGEQGFETDTNKLKIGDGTSAWSALAYVSGGSSGSTKLVVQDPTQNNEYYIYVGAPGNALSPIANLANTATNYEYDQSFATAQEAFNFIMTNDFAAPSNRNGVLFDTTNIVVAFEGGATHTIDSVLSIAGVDEQLSIVSQNAVNPLGYQSSGNVAVVGAIGNEIRFEGCNWIGVGGDFEFPCDFSVEMGSHCYDAESDEWNDYTLWQGKVNVQYDSTMITDNHGFIGTDLIVEYNSFYSAADIEASVRIRARRNGEIYCQTYTKAPDFSIQESILNTSTMEITTGSVGTSLIDAGSVVKCRSTFTDSGSPGASFNITQGSSFSASSFNFPSATEFFVSGVLYNSTYFAALNAGFCIFGDCVFRSTSNTGLSVPLMPTVDPVDGGKTFYLNAGVMTLSS